MEKKLLLQLIALFLIAQAIGLFVAINLIGAISLGEMEQPGFVSQDPNDIGNAIFLVAYILIGTGIFLLSLKFVKKAIFFRLLEVFITFITAWLVFELAFGEPLGIILAVALVVLRIKWQKNIWLRNASSIISVGVVGALVGIVLGIKPTPLLGISPIIVFIIALAIYDYIAVFKTKHMVALAKGISGKNLAFTIAMPTPQHTFELGTGDFVVPLAFATSAMREAILSGSTVFFVMPLLILFGSILGLVLTLEYLSKRIGIALPALPLQTAIMLLVFGIGKIAGF